MKTKLFLPLVLALLATTLLSSCESGRRNRSSGAMSNWQRSRM